MSDEGELVLAGGFASQTGPRPDNQDFGGVHLGSALERWRHGSLAAVADGVSSGRAGRVAAELAVRSLIEGFYAMPDTLGPARKMKAPLQAYNRWLYTQGRGETLSSSATTFTACALRDRRADLVHVGDSRAWRFAEGRLTQLTTDHVRPEHDLSHVLVRAIGMEADLRLDHATIELAEHDRLLLTTDGVHSVLSDKRIAALLARRDSAEATAAELVETALRAGSGDNATALVLEVVRLPAPTYDFVFGGLENLPVIEPPAPGTSIDGFAIERLISESRYASLLAATDREDGGLVALKFPRPEVLSDRAIRLAFAREMLISQRVDSPFLLRSRPLRPGRQSALYGVQPLIDGESLEARIARGAVSITNGVAIAVKLTRAAAALHRLDIIHRDIKPENVMLAAEGGVQLIEFGVARLPRVEDFRPDEIPGTPGYMAPEQFTGNAGDVQTDIFGLGVTLYRLFAGEWPFGAQEAFQRPRFGRPRHREDIPSWLDDAILTAIAPERSDRFEDAVGLLRRLEGGGRIARPKPGWQPLIERDPVRFWQLVSACMAAALILALVFR